MRFSPAFSAAFPRRAALGLTAFVALGCASARAQAPAPKPNLLADNSGFEQFAPSAENLWSGVSSDGALANFTFSPNVASEKGAYAPVAAPPSVAFVDLNGDGKPDLITADPTGYFHFYPNIGTATAPAFADAELIPIFLSTSFRPREWEWQSGEDETQRMCPRFALADWRRTGLLDLLVGNYYGEFLFLPNVGSARQPVYRTPPPGNVPRLPNMTPEATLYASMAAGITNARVQTTDQGRFWGNLFAPAAVNLTGNGRPDLIVGEGTYSANAIHLLSNQGGDSVPKFNKRDNPLAFGDGREQLIPTMGDFNGDGLPDLVVGDRTGEVGLYLNPGRYDPKVEFKRTSTLTFGGTAKLPGAVAPFAADYNGDGLIDLIIGTPNGHISVALNTGTKTEPKFAPLMEIKGKSRYLRNIKLPTGWKSNLWKNTGNALAYITVVNAQDDPEAKPPEGTNCLKAGYWPMSGQTFPMPDTGIPGAIKHFTIYHDGLTLNVNKPYKISFKVKGVGMDRLHYELETRFQGHPGMDKVEHDERGGAKHSGVKVDEFVHLGNNFTSSANWTTVEAILVPKYKSPDLRDETTMPMRFFFDFYGTTLSSQLYIDDIKLVEQ